ncbi:MAG: ATP-binding domain-containing protein, partial [Myxococcales bacterium]|nr:ATP-binding domain-containing protein [Myxococcales bacterium]
GAVARHTRIQFTDTTEQAHRDVDADRLVAIDGRALDAGTPLEDAGTFDREDVPVLFELARRRAASHRGADPAAKLPRYDHVVVDEAQLLAPLELAAIGAALAPRGTVTISGDHRQATDDTACFRGWALAAEELGVDAEPVTLTTTYRSGPAITAFARALAAGPATPTPGDEIRVSTFASELHAIDQIGGALAALRPRDRGVTVAVVARNDAHARRVHRELERAVEATLVQGGAFTFLPGVVVTSCAEVAGLEFDAVVIAELTPGFYPDTDEARRALYVACTRARDWLWLTTVGPWSPLLGPTT